MSKNIAIELYCDKTLINIYCGKSKDQAILLKHF